MLVRSRRFAAALSLVTLLVSPRAQSRPVAAAAPPGHAALAAEFDTALASYLAASRALGASEGWKKAFAAKDQQAMAALQRTVVPVDRAAFGRRFRAAADQSTGDEQAQLLVWVALQSRDAELCAQAVRDLLARHRKSPRLLPWVQTLDQASERTERRRNQELLAQVITDTPHAEVKAAALFAAARLVQTDPTAGTEARARAEEQLTQAIELSAGTEQGDRIAAPRFQKERLQKGMPVPEIHGTDLDGKPLSLAALRGKVVVLSFWATWCEGCMALVPHERELMERLKDRPFTIVGVNGDPDRAVARQTTVEQKMAWPSFWNGPKGPQGPIATRWNVQGWPTIYVIDATGVIRHVQVGGGNLERIVTPLLDEARAPGR